MISSAVYSYRLPRWQDQEHYVEMYCEKEAGEGKLKPVADKYHIHFGANKGYSSASMMYQMGQRIKNQLQNHKKVIVLYLDGVLNPVEINIDETSFWNVNCRELIKKEVGEWLINNNRAPWPKNNPPRIKLEKINNNIFKANII